MERRRHYSRSDNLKVDFTYRLPSGVTLDSGASATCIKADYGVVGDLTVGSPTISGNFVLVPNSGGTCGNLQEDGEYQTRYCITVTVVKSDGKTDAVNIELVVYDCVEHA